MAQRKPKRTTGRTGREARQTRKTAKPAAKKRATGAKAAAKRTTAKGTPAKRTPAKRTPARKATGAKAAPRKTSPRTTRRGSGASQERSNETKAAARELHPGDRVRWNTSQGKTTGRVERELTSPTRIKAFAVAASEEEPHVLVQSEKTGQEVAHRPESLEKVPEE